MIPRYYITPEAIAEVNRIGFAMTAALRVKRAQREARRKLFDAILHGPMVQLPKPWGFDRADGADASVARDAFNRQLLKHTLNSTYGKPYDPDMAERVKVVGQQIMRVAGERGWLHTQGAAR